MQTIWSELHDCWNTSLGLVRRNRMGKVMNTYCKSIDIFSSLCGCTSWLCGPLRSRIIQVCSPPLLSPISISELSPCLSLPLLYLSLSVPQMDPFLSLIHSLPLRPRPPECTEGIRQRQQYSRCTPAVQAGTTATAAPVLWPAAAGYTWREESLSSLTYSSLWPSVTNSCAF